MYTNLDSFIEVTDQRKKCIFIKLVTQLFKKLRLQTFLEAQFSFTLGFVLERISLIWLIGVLKHTSLSESTKASPICSSYPKGRGKELQQFFFSE